MKILYIHKKIEAVSGGSKCQEANLFMLKKIAGESQVFVYSKEFAKETKWRRNYNRFCTGRFVNFNKADITNIFNIIEKENVGVVFFDGSQMGFIAEKIKKRYPNIKIITFFHNVELLFLSNSIKNLLWYQRVLAQFDKLNIYISEKSACKYSDYIISLNHRDANLICKIYNRYPEGIFPISLKDEFNPSYIKIHSNTVPIGLMVGSYFPPNIKGLDWFINKVFPYINIELIVVGSGMDILQKKYENIKNLKIYGYVEDLKEIYAMVDFMIMPIFEGSGMKVKTAEALEYGKYIYAAPEATVGYQFSENEIKVCTDAADFINSINQFSISEEWNGFNQTSRNLFLKNYSYDSLENRYRILFNQIFKK